MKSKAQKKREDMFKGLPPHIARLYKAVENYIKKTGGSVSVIGGIQIMHWPHDGEYRYTVAIPCGGAKPPSFQAATKGQQT